MPVTFLQFHRPVSESGFAFGVTNPKSGMLTFYTVSIASLLPSTLFTLAVMTEPMAASVLDVGNVECKTYFLPSQR